MSALNSCSLRPCELDIIEYHIHELHGLTLTLIELRLVIMLNLTLAVKQERKFGTFTEWHYAHAIVCSCCNMSLSNAIVAFSVNHLLRHTYGATSTYIDEDTDYVAKLYIACFLEAKLYIIWWISTWIILKRLKPYFQYFCEWKPDDAFDRIIDVQ